VQLEQAASGGTRELRSAYDYGGATSAISLSSFRRQPVRSGAKLKPYSKEGLRPIWRASHAGRAIAARRCRRSTRPRSGHEIPGGDHYLPRQSFSINCMTTTGARELRQCFWPRARSRTRTRMFKARQRIAHHREDIEQEMSAPSYSLRRCCVAARRAPRDRRKTLPFCNRAIWKSAPRRSG